MLINDKFSSPNCAKRKELIKYVILHFTELAFKDALARLCDAESEVSAHYLIKESGEVFQLVEDQKVAWHAGVSSWHGKSRINQNSIGIELDNLGNREFSEVQMRSCIKLCSILAKKYNLPKENFIGHSDIAPERKIDPGIFFDWKLLHEKGFGVWHGLDPSSLNIDLYKIGDIGEGISNIQTKLKKIGYKPYANKHGESIFTKFFQNYYLPKKFNYDKRIPHLSSLILSNQMSRDKAIELVSKNPYNDQELSDDIEYIIKKLQISKDEFDSIMNCKKSYYEDFPNWLYLQKIIRKIQSYYLKIFKKNIKVYS